MLPIFTTGQVKDGVDTGDFMIDLSDYIKKKDAATKTELSELTSVVANKLDAEPQHKHHIQDIKDLQEVLQGKFDTSEKYSFNTLISDIDKIPYIEAPKIKMLEIARDQYDSMGYKFYVDESSGDLMICSDDVLLANYTKSSNSWSFGGVNVNNISTHQEVLENHTEALNAVCNATLVNINNIGENATKISNVESIINTSLTNHQEILENHSEALNAVCSATLVNITNISANSTKINTVESIINEYIAKTDAVLKNHYDALLELCEKHGMVDSNTGDGDQITPR